jgi:hypothetical protein
VAIRLPDLDARREVDAGAKLLGRRNRIAGSWVLYRPRRLAEAERLVPLLEIAVHHAAVRRSTP